MTLVTVSKNSSRLVQQDLFGMNPCWLLFRIVLRMSLSDARFSAKSFFTNKFARCPELEPYKILRQEVFFKCWVAVYIIIVATVSSPVSLLPVMNFRRCRCYRLSVSMTNIKLLISPRIFVGTVPWPSGIFRVPLETDP
jgi:hypothetical protein